MKLMRPAIWMGSKNTWITWRTPSLACQRSGFVDQSDGAPAHSPTCKPGTMRRLFDVTWTAMKWALQPQTKNSVSAWSQVSSLKADDPCGLAPEWSEAAIAQLEVCFIKPGGNDCLHRVILCASGTGRELRAQLFNRNFIGIKIIRL